VSIQGYLYLGKEVGLIAAEYYFIDDIHIGSGGQPQKCDFAARGYLLCKNLYQLNEAEVKV
jgi:hypothetical protein